MSQSGKPTPGVPDVRAEISRKQEAMGLPALGPATDTADGPPGPTKAEIVAALATIERVQVSLDETARVFARWLAAQGEEG